MFRSCFRLTETCGAATPRLLKMAAVAICVTSCAWSPRFRRMLTCAAARRAISSFCMFCADGVTIWLIMGLVMSETRSRVVNMSSIFCSIYNTNNSNMMTSKAIQAATPSSAEHSHRQCLHHQSLADRAPLSGSSSGRPPFALPCRRT